LKKDSAIGMLFDYLPVEIENENLESIMNKILNCRKFKNIKFMHSVC
jgi:hypothetical protein